MKPKKKSRLQGALPSQAEIVVASPTTTWKARSPERRSPCELVCGTCVLCRRLQRPAVAAPVQ